MSDREQHLVELVDECGVAIGSCTVERAHRPPGRVHRAFSVLLVDPAGRLLLQQRAPTKTRFPLRWANACCGHPAPGEDVPASAAKRLVEELGLMDVPLRQVGIHRYLADDPVSRQVEAEYDHVLVGVLTSGQAADPAPTEVARVRWFSPADLAEDLATTPGRYAPWLPGVLAAWPDWRR